MDIPLNIDMNKSNLSYLLNAWLRLYFQERDNEELEKWSKKITDALSMKVDGVKILSQYIVDELADAFATYQKAKIEYEERMDEIEDFISPDDYEEVLRGYIQGIKSAYITALVCMRLD